MNLTAEQIQQNWMKMMGFIEDHISSPRKEKLIEFYEKYSECLVMIDLELEHIMRIHWW